MKDSTLLAIALIISLAGVAALYIISDSLEIDEQDLDKIGNAESGKNVKVKGALSKVNVLENVAFLELSQPSKITVVAFNRKNVTISLKEGDNVEIIGKVDEFEGKQEIIANYIRLIP